MFARINITFSISLVCGLHSVLYHFVYYVFSFDCSSFVCLFVFFNIPSEVTFLPGFAYLSIVLYVVLFVYCCVNEQWLNQTMEILEHVNELCKQLKLSTPILNKSSSYSESGWWTDSIGRMETLKSFHTPGWKKQLFNIIII